MVRYRPPLKVGVAEIGRHRLTEGVPGTPAERHGLVPRFHTGKAAQSDVQLSIKKIRRRGDGVEPGDLGHKRTQPLTATGITMVIGLDVVRRRQRE